MNIVIREEKSSDILAIHRLTAAAFIEAPHTDHTEQFIIKALRDSGALTISLVAEMEGNLVGHVALSPVSITDNTPAWYGLGPISVLPSKQGLGIGSKLMHAAIQALKNMEANGCVLLGEPLYYQRFGFKPFDSLVLPDVPPEYFLALPFKEHVPQGKVSYHQAFSAKA